MALRPFMANSSSMLVEEVSSSERIKSRSLSCSSSGYNYDQQQPPGTAGFDQYQSKMFYLTYFTTSKIDF